MRPNRFLPVGLAFCVALTTSAAEGEPVRAQNPNFDQRRSTAAHPLTLEGARFEAADRLQARMEGVRIDLDAVVGSPKFIHNRYGFLSAPASEREIDPRVVGIPSDSAENDPHRPIKEFLDEHAGLFGHGSDLLEGARKTRDYVTEHNGMRTVVWQQELDDIPVFDAVLYGHITRNGELVSLCSLFVPEPAKAADAGVTNRLVVQLSPPVSAQQAVANAATNISETLRAEEVIAKGLVPEGPEHRQQFTAPPLVGDAVADLVWLAMDRTTMRLCWRVILTGKTSGEQYQILIDAESGEAQVRHCWTAYFQPASFRVFDSDSPTPLSPGWTSPDPPLPSQPAFRPQVDKLNVRSIASPNGWIADGSSATIGNNVDAYLDVLNLTPPPAYGVQIQFPAGARPVGTDVGNELRFWFTVDLNQPPKPTPQTPAASENQKAAVVNAFYWCNWMHDKLYELGFTEAAGNFQWDNFGRGGAGGDPVLVRVQNGAEQDNEQNPPGPPRRNQNRMQANNIDGVPARMLLEVFDGPLALSEQERDAALNAETILHEYTHGMNRRLVGHGSSWNTAPAFGFGLDEGWADFFALACLSEEGDDPALTYAKGGYIARNWEYSGQGHPEPPVAVDANYYFGLLLFPYSTALTYNPLTFKDLDQIQGSQHTSIPRNPTYPADLNDDLNTYVKAMQLWAVALLEVRANLVADHGFTVGNDLAMRLVVDSLKLCPPDPGFIEARDALLLADRVHSGGANQTRIWEAFKKRGMGWSAEAPNYQTTEGIVEAYDLPPQGNQLWNYATGNTIYSSPAIGPGGIIYVGSSDGYLYAINPSGQLVWAFTEPTTYISFNSAPMVGEDGTIYARRQNGYLYAINANGTLRWKTQISYDSWVSPALGPDGTIYVAGYTELKAISPQGSILWTFPTGNTIYSSPAIAPDGTIYFGSMDARLYAVDPNTQQLKPGNWPVVTGGPVVSSPAISREGTIYVGSYDGKLYALNPDGSYKWSPVTLGGGSVVDSSPAIGPDGTIYIGSRDYKVYAINPETGQVKPGWPYTTGYYVRSSPAVAADGTVFVGSYDGKLHALKRDGTPAGAGWPFYTGGSVFSSPVIGANGTVYVGSSNGKVFALSGVSGLAHSDWPMFRQNPWHTGSPATLALASGEWLDELGFQFEIRGLSGMICQVEGSDNLIAWSPLPDPHEPTLVTLPAGGIATYLDGQAAGYSCRFYRVRSDSILSFNSLGYMGVNIPTGSSMIANQLDNPAGSRVGVLLPNAPDETVLYKWNGTTYDITEYFAGYGWDDPNMTLNPGEGVFVEPGAATTFTFIGDTRQGMLASSFPSGFSIRSSIAPQAGPIDTALGFGPIDGDMIYRLNNGLGTYETHEYIGSFDVWDPAVPIIRLGESFWIGTMTARTWGREFTVW